MSDDALTGVVQPPDFLKQAMEAHGVDPDEVARRAAADDVIPSDEAEAVRQAAVAGEGLRCSTCPNRVNPADPNVLREVTGWAKPRDAGGQNHVIDRVETGRLMCAECGSRLIHLGHVGSGQESLL